MNQSECSELLATSGFNSQPEDLEVKFSKLDPSLKSTKFPNKTRRSIKFTATKSSEFNLNNKKQKHWTNTTKVENSEVNFVKILFVYFVLTSGNLSRDGNIWTKSHRENFSTTSWWQKWASGKLSSKMIILDVWIPKFERNKTTT